MWFHKQLKPNWRYEGFSVTKGDDSSEGASTKKRRLAISDPGTCNKLNFNFTLLQMPVLRRLQASYWLHRWWMLVSRVRVLRLKPLTIYFSCQKCPDVIQSHQIFGTQIQHRRNPILYKQTCISTGFKTTTTTSIVSTYQTVAGLVETPIACHKATCSLVQSVE